MVYEAGPLAGSQLKPAGSRDAVSLTLSIVEDHLAVCRLKPEATVPQWATRSALFSVTRTVEELSIVCAEREVPGGVACERGWRGLKLEGPFDFSLVGILVSVLGPLAEAGVGIFALSTYDTDYVLVKEEELKRALSALVERGHRVT